MKAARFTISEVIAPINGYTNGNLWNGWECPMFEKSEAIEICNILSANGTDENIDGDFYRYDAVNDSFVLDYYEFGTLVSSEIYTANVVDGKELYSIGAFGWCWQIA
jgi:hypothetical protein